MQLHTHPLEHVHSLAFPLGQRVEKGKFLLLKLFLRQVEAKIQLWHRVLGASTFSSELGTDLAGSAVVLGTDPWPVEPCTPHRV